MLIVMAGLRRKLQFLNASEPRFVGSSNLATATQKVIALGKLGHADGGQKIGKITLVAGIGDFVIPAAFLRVSLPGIAADPVKPHQSGTLCELWIVGGEHTALGGRNGLCGVETECRQPGNRPNA